MTALDRKYREDLTLALRLRDISGARVGEVLAEVEAHVAETGEDPTTAFGTPKEYAATIAAQLDTRSGRPTALQKTVGGLATGALAYVGVTLLLRSLTPEGPAVSFTTANVVAAIAFLALMTTGFVLSFQAATTLAQGKVYGILGGCTLIASLAAFPLSGVLFDDETPLIEISRWVAVGLGGVAVAASVLLLAVAIRHGRIVDPR
ncbi:HAAS signaling domain-containing protein [Nonomuraea sp. NPDC004354]